MSMRQLIVRQFKQPKGWLGRLAGRLMASRESNIERNKWVVSLLELNDSHRVLEMAQKLLKLNVLRTGQCASLSQANAI